jgi:type II secretory pathway component GspD/PulD (secretin)
MRMLSTAALLSFLTLWGSVHASEQPTKAEAEAKAEKRNVEPEEVAKKMSRKVSMKFVNSHLEELLATLSSAAQVEMIEVDPRLDREGRKRITITVEEVTVREVLDQVARELGACAWYCDGGYWIAKEPPESATTDRPMTPLTDEQRRLAAQAIADLSGEDKDKRVAAGQRLKESGLPVLPMLEEDLAAPDSSLERQRCLVGLIEEVRLAGGLDAELAKALRNEADLKFDNAPLEKVLAFLAGQSGGVFSADPDLAKKRFSMRMMNMRMDYALEWIARIAEARLIKTGKTIKLVKKP